MSNNDEYFNTFEGWDPRKPHQTLPKLPPPIDLESKKILKRCVEARASLAELKQSAELIPNQAMLISLLPALEAQASSEIENIITTTDRLFQQIKTEEGTKDPATKEAERYSKALLEGFKAIIQYPISTRTAEEVCSTIKGIEMSVRKVPGTQLVNDRTGEVIYTPPEGEDLLRNLLGNWGEFLHDVEEKKIDPLIRMAVAHYQFEAIHPFGDGNGRTGRVLNSLFLIQENLLNLPILYLSRYLIENKDEYYRLLSSVTNSGNWEEWIIFILDGVENTSRWTRLKIEAIRKLKTHTTEFLQNKTPNLYSYELVSLIFEFPYCRIQDLTEKLSITRQTASKHLQELVSLNVLREHTFGREKLFAHPKLMKLLSQESNVFDDYSVKSNL